MKIEENQINKIVNEGLGAFTNGAIFRDGKVYITLNFPDGDKNSIEGEWRHMSDSNRLSERVRMLQNAIYEEFPDFHLCIPREWAR